MTRSFARNDGFVTPGIIRARLAFEYRLTSCSCGSCKYRIERYLYIYARAHVCARVCASDIRALTFKGALTREGGKKRNEQRKRERDREIERNVTIGREKERPE